MAVKMPKERDLSKELREMFSSKGSRAMLNFMNTASQQAADTDVSNLKRLGGEIGAELDRSGLLADLNTQAKEGLARGGALSEEEIRDLNLGARAGFADRGMAMSNPAIAQELLNRHQYTTMRSDQAKQFGLQVAGLEQNRDAQILNLLGRAGNQTSAVTGGLMNYGADLNNTNLNMQASLYNSQQNNQAAIQGQKSASSSATNAALIGAGGAIVGGALILF